MPQRRAHRWTSAGLAMLLAAATSIVTSNSFDAGMAEAKPGGGKGGGQGGGGQGGGGQGGGGQGAGQGNGKSGGGQGHQGNGPGGAGAGKGQGGNKASAGKGQAKGTGKAASEPRGKAAAAAAPPRPAHNGVVVAVPAASPKRVRPLAKARKPAERSVPAGLALSSPSPAATRGDDAEPRFRPGRILVAAPDRRTIEALAAQGYRIAATVGTPLGSSVATVEIPGGVQPSAAVAALRLSVPGVKVTVDTIYRPADGGEACTGPGCASFAMIDWTLSANVSCAGALPAIGMLDTAVDLDHPALKGRSIERLDLGQAQPAAASSPAHGTAIASLLVGARDGSAPGLLPTARLLAVDVFRGGAAGDETDAARLIEGLGLLIEHGAKVINLSLAGPPNSLLEAAVAAARAKGVVIVAAAGNDGPGAAPAYPAAYDGVVAVTAVDTSMGVYPRASQGEYIDLAAPGVGLVTASPDGRTVVRSGTSYAAPFVTAAAAVALATAPQRSPVDLVEALEGQARDLGAPGRDPVFGSGLVWVGDTCAARDPVPLDQAGIAAPELGMLASSDARRSGMAPSIELRRE